MKTIVVSVIGLDSSGIVYTVANTLAVFGCDIQEASQSILKNQAAAIFVVSRPESLQNAEIHNHLIKAIQDKGMHLVVSISDFVDGASTTELSEPFVVTVQGSDGREIIASISKIFAEHHVNIESFKATCLAEHEQTALLFFEVALPKHVNFAALRKTLMDRAAQMGLMLSMQHRDIFEAVHRVSPV